MKPGNSGGGRSLNVLEGKAEWVYRWELSAWVTVKRYTMGLQ